MSKFDFDIFYGDENIFAVSKSRHTEAEADKLFIEQIDLPLKKANKTTGWVYYGIGYIEEYSERVNGYWFNTEPHGRYPQECWAYVY